jgi:hypothetical protein
LSSSGRFSFSGRTLLHGAMVSVIEPSDEVKHRHDETEQSEPVGWLVGIV